jgi:Rrf2 family protein
MAEVEKGKALTSREIAGLSGIPANYLAKVLAVLKRLGFLEATRGPKGGYWLKRSPEDIRLVEVAIAFDGESAIPSCVLQHARVCSDDLPCSAHSSWAKVKDAYADFLDKTTIAMVTSPPGLPTRIDATGGEIETVQLKGKMP